MGKLAPPNADSDLVRARLSLPVLDARRFLPSFETAGDAGRKDRKASTCMFERSGEIGSSLHRCLRKGRERRGAAFARRNQASLVLGKVGDFVVQVFLQSSRDRRVVLRCVTDDNELWFVHPADRRSLVPPTKAEADDWVPARIPLFASAVMSQQCAHAAYVRWSRCLKGEELASIYSLKH